MRRKKRRPAVEVSPEAVANASGSDSSEGQSGRTKVYLGILFAIAALALVYVYTQMGSTPPPTDSGKNQSRTGQTRAIQSGRCHGCPDTHGCRESANGVIA